MQRPAIVPVVIACSAAIGVCEKGQQRLRALHLTCDAAPRHRAGSGCLRCGHQRVRKFQQSQQASSLLRARRNQTMAPDVGDSCFAPDVSAPSAAISACAKGRPAQPALQPLRAVQHHGIAPEVLMRRAAVSAGENGQPCHRACLLLRALQHQELLGKDLSWTLHL